MKYFFGFIYMVIWFTGFSLTFPIALLISGIIDSFLFARKLDKWLAK